MSLKYSLLVGGLPAAGIAGSQDLEGGQLKIMILWLILNPLLLVKFGGGGQGCKVPLNFFKSLRYQYLESHS